MIPYRELVIEFGTLSCRLDISVKLHEGARQCSLGNVVIHESGVEHLTPRLDARYDDEHHLDQFGHQVGVLNDVRGTYRDQQPSDEAIFHVVCDDCGEIPEIWGLQIFVSRYIVYKPKCNKNVSISESNNFS